MWGNLSNMGRLKDLQPPPRHVPLGVRVKAIFGGFLQQFGWLFFTFGMLFVLIFFTGGGAAEGLARELAFRGERGIVQGVITSAHETSASENETEIVYFQYEYKVDGQTYGGESYTTGWISDVDQNATVEYLKSDPSLSRLQSGRWSQFSPWIGLFVGIFPAVGLAMALASLPHGLRSAKLLKYGRVAYGTLVSKEPTNTSVNEQTVYEFTFKFTAESTGREHFAKAKTHETEILEDEEQEPLLYLPSFPEHAVLFDNLPGSPTVDQRGHLTGGSIFSALLYALMPTLGTLEVLVVINDLYSAFFG